MYQANYGFTATGEHNPNVNVTTENDNASNAESAVKRGKDGSGAGTLISCSCTWIFFSFHHELFKKPLGWLIKNSPKAFLLTGPEGMN